MSPAQFRVLVLIFLAAAINIGYNADSKANFSDFLKAVGTANTNVSLSYVRHESAWIAAAVILVILTGVSEQLGTWLALITLALVAFKHASQIGNTISTVVANTQYQQVPENSVPLRKGMATGPRPIG